MKRLVTILLFLWSITFFAHGQSVVIPKKSNRYINDYANVIPDEKEESLAVIAKGQEDKSTAQMVIVITNDVPEGYPIADYAQELFEKWGLGQKGVNNGLLIIVFPNQRQSRIHVGYGLEGILTDGYTKRVQKNHLNPYFKQGDYYGGIHSLMQELVKQMDPETIAQLKAYEQIKTQERKELMSDLGDWFLYIISSIVVIIGCIFGYTRQQRIKREKIEAAEKAERERIQKEIIERNRQENLKRQAELRKSAAKQSWISLQNRISSSIEFLKMLSKENFLNSNEALEEMQDLKNLCSDTWSENFDVDKIEKLCQKYNNSIEELTYELKKNWDWKMLSEEAIDEAKTYLNYEKNVFSFLQNKIQELSKTYGPEIWNYPISLKNFNHNSPALNTNYARITSALSAKVSSAQKELDDKNFDKANNFATDINLLILSLVAFADEVNKKEEQIKEADNYVKKSMLNFNNDLTTATQNIKNNIVENSLRIGYLEYVKNINLKDFTNSNLCVMDRAQHLKEVINHIDSYNSQAMAQIKIHQDKVDAEIQAKKEAADNERRRKERERQDEEDRQNSLRRAAERRAEESSYSSSSSSYDSGSSSFGGGSSGGGGSDNSW